MNTRTIATAAAILALFPSGAQAASCAHTNVTLHRITVQRDNFVDTTWNLRTDYDTVYSTFRITDDQGHIVASESTTSNTIAANTAGIEYYDQLPDDTKRGKTYKATIRISDGHGCTTDAAIRFKTR